MSITEMSITNPKKQLEFYKQLSEQLQQENQQLKDRNKLLEKHYTQLEKDYGEELGRNIVYKFVLDEIREYIANNKETTIIYTGEVWSESVDARELEEILDKVKGVD